MSHLFIAISHLYIATYHLFIATSHLFIAMSHFIGEKVCYTFEAFPFMLHFELPLFQIALIIKND